MYLTVHEIRWSHLRVYCPLTHMESQQSGFQLANTIQIFLIILKKATNAQRAKEKTGEHKARMNWVYLHWSYLLSFPEV